MFTFDNAKKVKSIFFDVEKSEKKLFQLPSIGKPTKAHRTLGNFKWEMTNTDAIDKLNKVAVTVMNFEETTIPPKDTEDRNKYDVRLALRPILANNMSKLYFQWNYDYRGRMYASGYQFALQGNEYEKNIFRFSNAIKITNMEDYRKCETAIFKAIAVAFGKDKITDDQKLVWFEENEGKLNWKNAKEPTYARAQLQALKELREHDLISIPIELDKHTCPIKIA
jgi:DNA-directed RNA polymerase